MQHINRLFAFIVPLLSNFRSISLDCYNLAHTFGVSTRTIYTDLGKMKGKYLIDVIPGRYGGVYLALEPTNTFKYLTKEQEKTLQDLLPSQPAEIHCILQSILDAFARKHP